MNSLKRLTLVAAGSLLLTGAPAVADEIIIIHRSGKIQTLQIDSAADPVDQVSFRRKAPEPATAPQVQAAPPAAGAATPPKVTAAPATAPAAKAAAPTGSDTKSGVKIKWAEPIDATY